MKARAATPPPLLPLAHRLQKGGVARPLIYGALRGHQASATNRPGVEQEGGRAEQCPFLGLSAFSKAKAQPHQAVGFSIHYQSIHGR